MFNILIFSIIIAIFSLKDTTVEEVRARFIMTGIIYTVFNAIALNLIN